MSNSQFDKNMDCENKMLEDNLMEMGTKLCTLLESNENSPESELEPQPLPSGSTTHLVLAELQANFKDLSLDNAPHFEFHGYGCHALVKRTRDHEEPIPSGRHQKKSKSGAGMQQQLQRQNLFNWNQLAPMMRSIGLRGDCVERNVVVRLMNLFKSLHDHMNQDLGVGPENSLPSDYVFDLPKKITMPCSLDLHHQVQVICTKADRFLAHQRRVLEANRHFDYRKYTECDKLLKGSSTYLKSFRQFTRSPIRHRDGIFLGSGARSNALKLEDMLTNLREWLRAAYLCVYVFNWEMDHEHRYSLAMSKDHNALMDRAKEQATSELKAAQPKELSAEEKLIAHRFKLQNVIECAAENDDFLSTLLKNPDAYFPAEARDICAQQEAAAGPAAEAVAPPVGGFDLLDISDLLEPSSPPKRATTTRRFKPLCFRS
ncbi:protein bag-of-marbles [Drosophila guanche]|uniref:Blast:Protein bag-of-marbles n=1 Tax=Drosophila guanche TaxID=7266 RepID=A0A3B0JNK2_DROGU|nr:protein bag-of-marbles [Drosophila guanche]SPP83814.1 blast:Protein bag-of-marbles [Drosophila guanche]